MGRRRTESSVVTVSLPAAALQPLVQRTTDVASTLAALIGGAAAAVAQSGG
jgi:hypothetical protein